LRVAFEIERGSVWTIVENEGSVLAPLPEDYNRRFRQRDGALSRMFENVAFPTRWVVAILVGQANGMRAFCI
jgi:hypothetical protein